MSTPESGGVILGTNDIVELDMAAIHREAEEEVVRIVNGDALIHLLIDDTVVTLHNSHNVCRTVAIVRDIGGHLGTVHGSKPCTPVALATAGRQVRVVIITSTPTVVVGTNHCILGIVCLAEHYNEVVPVVLTIGVVGESADEGLARVHLDVV